MSNPWNEKESQDRRDKFIASYDELVKKYDVEFMAFPQLVPSGQHGFNTSAVLVPMDKRRLPVASPMQDERGDLMK